MNGHFIKLTKEAVKEISKNNLTGMVLSYLCCNQGVGTGVCRTNINEIVSNSGCTCDRHSTTGINRRVKNCLIELEKDGFISNLDDPVTETNIYIQKASYADDLYLEPYNPSEKFVMIYTENYYKLIQYSLKNGYKFADLINLYIFIISHINRSIPNAFCNTSTITMQKALNISEHTLDKYTKALIDCGLIRKKRGDAEHSNQYFLTDNFEETDKRSALVAADDEEDGTAF